MAFWLREIHRSGQVLQKLGNIRRKSLVKESRTSCCTNCVARSSKIQSPPVSSP